MTGGPATRRAVAAGALTLCGALLGALGGCGAGAGGGAHDAGAPGATTDADSLSGTVVVLAAASLTDVFTELGDRMTAAHPDVTVTFGFAGSGSLAQQVAAGAPADVLATASPETMRTVTDHGDAAGEPVLLARNRLEVAVPAGNPAGVTGLADLADPDLRIALCAPEVPCGAAAATAFARADLTPAPDTLESDVRAALTKVRLGEVDAALVYRTDVRAAGADVDGVDLPADLAVATDYPITTLTASANPAAARAFVDLVLSAEGREVLRDAGFELP